MQKGHSASSDLPLPQPSRGSIATLHHVTRVYGNGVNALGPIDLDIRQGEFLSLLGPSGCGKSTALRLIAGLLTPSSGALEWNGEKPHLSFVFQDPTLLPWANVRENVRLPLDLARVDRGEANARAEAALTRLGLSGFEDSYPRALSGGMRMRVSIARAFVARPQLLLMDEPFAALDEPTRENLNEDLLRLWREDAMTIVFVTHSVYESTFLSKRVVALTPRPGRIAADITIAQETRDAAWRLSPDFAAKARRVAEALRGAAKVPA